MCFLPHPLPSGKVSTHFFLHRKTYSEHKPVFYTFTCVVGTAWTGKLNIFDKLQAIDPEVLIKRLKMRLPFFGSHKFSISVILDMNIENQSHINMPV